MHKRIGTLVFVALSLAPLAASAGWYGYSQYPHRYPHRPGMPNPPAQRADAFCIVSFEGVPYSGEGVGVDMALARARSACLRAVNNARDCNEAVFTCRE